jgi:WD40 repeat protein
VASGSQGAAKIWDAMTGQEIALLEHGHESFVGGIAWSPDGSTIASGVLRALPAVRMGAESSQVRPRVPSDLWTRPRARKR